MTLGQRIYNLRTERNLSQTDLAEQLDVSRQSVSKWETDASVPDLDKLVKLCDLFGISLDELVRGVETKEEETAQPQVIVREVRVGTPTRVIVGAALLVIGVLVGMAIMLTVGDGLEVLLLAFPFVLCGVICMAVKEHPAVWCVWLLFALACVYAPLMLGTWLYAAVMLFIALAATTTTLDKKKEKES